MSNKKVLMVMPVMKGGGAERVAALLLNEFQKNGVQCEFILTSSDREEIINRDLNEDIPITVLREHMRGEKSCTYIFYRMLRIFSSLVCRFFESLKKSVPASFAYLSFIAQYGMEVKTLRRIFEKNPEAEVITFLQPAIPMVLLAARGLPNKVIFSERADPYRLMKKRYGRAFIKKYYKRADKAVFQTNDALAAYPEEISCKGTVIPNPVNSKLPESYLGERNKNITTFCRISRQKNLPLLVRAFASIHREFSDYRLKIIGAPQTDDDKASLKETKELISELNLTDYVDFLPFSTEVHKEILKDAVYVNSSDYEGMSNAMLEAMAIGMPVVCTDCPIGGAATVIKNEHNGVLVSVGDAENLAEAIKKVINCKEFSEKLSKNAACISRELSAENIARKWMELL